MNLNKDQTPVIIRNQDSIVQGEFLNLLNKGQSRPTLQSDILYHQTNLDDNESCTQMMTYQIQTTHCAQDALYEEPVERIFDESTTEDISTSKESSRKRAFNDPQEDQSGSTKPLIKMHCYKGKESKTNVHDELPTTEDAGIISKLH